MAWSILSRTIHRRLWHGASASSTTAHMQLPAAAGHAVPFSTGMTHLEVCFVDPKVVLTQAKQLSPEDMYTIKLPAALASILGQAHMELGDADDPLNAWVCGARGEIFQMDLIGTIPTRSGYASIVPMSELETLKRGRRQLPLTWPQFLNAMEGEHSDPPYPFLFAGRILESSHASVYVLREGGQVTGLMISSMAAEQDED